MTTPEQNEKEGGCSRRGFLRGGLLGLAAASLGSVCAGALQGAGKGDSVWQIDPTKCAQCGRCATACVLTPSAVKCVHTFAICGYCELCGGYHQPGTKVADTAAEHQLCPTAAIQRTYVENPYYEYRILEELCIGCGKCVKGCGAFGNGSMYLQVRHDRCVNCNECAIGAVCPAEAFVRVPASRPYLLKSVKELPPLATAPGGRRVGADDAQTGTGK